MKQCPTGLQGWTPDEVAECLDGVSHPTQRRLWEILSAIPDADRVPLGGDGSDGTVEIPPEPDTYLEGRMGRVWGKLTDAERTEIADAYRKACDPESEED